MNHFPWHIIGEFAHVIIRWVQDQINRAANLDHLTIAHDGHAVRDAQGLKEIMRDKDDGFVQLGLNAQELILHLATDQRVQGAKGFIKEPKIGFDGQRPGNADALLLPTGQLPWKAVLAPCQANKFDDLRGFGAALGKRNALQFQGKGHVVEHVQMGHQAKILEHHAHLVSAEFNELLRGLVQQVFTV